MQYSLKPLVVLFLVFFNTLYSQDSIPPLDANRYLSLSEIQQIKNTVRSAPTLKEYKGCMYKDCDEIAKFSNNLYNLLIDIEEYQDYIEYSAMANKRSWQNYLETTIKNDSIKKEMQDWLAYKDFWARLSAVLVDLADIGNLAKTGKLSGSNVDKLLKVIDIIDDILSYFDVFFKTHKRDLDTNTLTEATGIPEVYTIYTNLKAHFDIIKETVQNIDKIKAWKSLSKRDKFYGLDSPKVANVGAAIANLLGLWSNEERERMKKAINEYDKLFKTNQPMQMAHYKRFNEKMNIWYDLEPIRPLINKKIEHLPGICAKCNATLKRKERISQPKDQFNFGYGLLYYRSLILEQTKAIQGIENKFKACVSLPFRFKVYDGLGARRTGYIRIYRKSDNKKLHEGSIKYGTYSGFFELFPDAYKIEVYEGYSKDNVRSVSRTMNLVVTRNETNTEIEIKDYGRVSIEVLNEKGYAIPFSYKFKDQEGATTSYSFTANAKEELFDVPSNTNYELEIKYKDKSEIVKDIKIKTNQINKLHFTYKKDSFIPTGTVSTTLEIPKSYVVGTLYNSNDGNCKMYTQRPIFFTIRNQNIYNLETGQFVEKVWVPSGKSIKVAVPSDRGHFRANYIPDDGKEYRISFWYYDDMTEGWYYSAGCENGTRPKERCFNGKITGRCGTLHEDY